MKQPSTHHLPIADEQGHPRGYEVGSDHGLGIHVNVDNPEWNMIRLRVVSARGLSSGHPDVFRHVAVLDEGVVPTGFNRHRDQAGVTLDRFGSTAMEFTIEGT